MTRPRPHLPMRPAWLCRTCAAPWPCGPAQLDLMIEFHGHSIALTFYLAASMREAIDDVYGLGLRPDLPAMHARFLGWLSLARRPRRSAAGDVERSGTGERFDGRCWCDRFGRGRRGRDAGGRRS